MKAAGPFTGVSRELRHNMPRIQANYRSALTIIVVHGQKVIKSEPLSIPKESAAPISYPIPVPRGRGRHFYNELRPLRG